METKIVNLHKDKYDVYIGRQGKGHDGYFGNPVRVDFICPVCGSYHRTAGSTIDCYRVYFRNRISSDSMFREAIQMLQGKRLGCFCKPGPCHGDVIKEYLDADLR